MDHHDPKVFSIECEQKNVLVKVEVTKKDASSNLLFLKLDTQNLKATKTASPQEEEGYFPESLCRTEPELYKRPRNEQLGCNK